MMTEIVLDTSVFISWLFSDESDAYVQGVMDGFFNKKYRFITPALFADEVLNVLLKGYSSKRLLLREYEQHIQTVRTYFPHFGLLNYEPTFKEIEIRGQLAIRYGLRSYDAHYLYISLQKNALLATTDKRLIQAAKLEKTYYDLN